jgi:uncharacterized protein
MEYLLFDVKQAMHYLGVDAATLANLILNEGLPAFRMNGEVKFHADELKGWTGLHAQKESLAAVGTDELLRLISESETKVVQRETHPSSSKDAEKLMKSVSLPDLTATCGDRRKTGDKSPAVSSDATDMAPEENKPLFAVEESASEEPAIVIYDGFSIKFLVSETMIRIKPAVSPDSPVFVKLAQTLEDLQVKTPDFESLKNVLIRSAGNWVKLKDVPSQFSQKLNIKISADGVRAYMVACTTDEGDYLGMLDVEEEIRKHGIREGIDRETARYLVSNKMFGNLMLIALGQDPIPGEDAKLEFHFDPNKVLTPNELESGNVDFKNLDNITNVGVGDLLVTKKPATNGESGRDVRGLPVAARSGKDVRIREGTNTVLTEDGNRLLAGTDGHVFLCNNVVHVENIYIVKGDVDFSTGNIDFAGIVIVNGFVREGFEVKADGNISVTGGVEGALVESRNGDINIRFGVQGQNKALIKAKGNVKAKFINQAKVEAGKDVIVKRAIMQCEVNSCGSVIAEDHHGRIIGGKIRASDTIVAHSIGSESNTKTYLFLEKYNPESNVPVRDILNRKKNKIDKEYKKSVSNIELLRRRLDMKNQDQGLIQTLKVAAQKAKELDHDLKQVTAEIEKFTADYGTVGTRFIRARGVIYPQVILNIENDKLKIDEKYNVATFCCDMENENKIICKEHKI